MKKKISRRTFVKGLGLATCGGMVHSLGANLTGSPFLAYAADAPSLPRSLGGDTTVVLINFRGGFPLNILPNTDGFWNDRFKDLANSDTQLALDGFQALHPSLTALKSIWDEGKLAVVNKVGYYSPGRGVGVNRSHSDSTDIFFGGVPDIATPSEGWAVRFTNLMSSSFSGISVGGTNFLIENGNNVRSFGDLGSLGESFYRRGGDWNTQEKHFKLVRDQLLSMGDSGQLGSVPLIRAANANIDRTIETLQRQTDPDTNPLPAPNLFGGGGLSRQLRDAARLINAPVLQTRFIYCEMGGYDTHSNEQAGLTNRLDDWNEAVGAFWQNIKQMNKENNVVCVTMSEFGRTTFKNGSGGTDHGHGAPWLLFGGRVAGGVKNHRPTLEDLKSGGSYMRNIDIEFPTILRSIVESMGYPGDAVFPNYPTSPLPLFT